MTDIDLPKELENLFKAEAEQEALILKDRNIYMFGEIEMPLISMFISDFQRLDKSSGDINLHICSLGGWADGGFALYDVIKNSKNLVTCYAHGAVYSAAVLPFLAGDRRVMYQSSRLLLHPVKIGMSGEENLMSLSAVSKNMKDIAELYFRYVAANSGLTFKEVEKMCETETFLTSKECKQMGLCDKIINNNKRRRK